MKTELMKIAIAEFGFGGYQNAQFGLSVTFSGNSVGCSTFEGGWATRPEHASWTLEDQAAAFYKAVILLRDTLTKAKKQTVAELAGTPVELTFDGVVLKSWRVLEEVL